MAPPVSFTKCTLSYPIVAAAFDPYRNYLVVGGGGGAGRSGVKNKIVCMTALDVSSRSEITTAAEIELSTDEDSVTSLANLAQKDSIITFAGINSSDAELKASRNTHFRSFEIKLPKKKSEVTERIQGEIQLLGQARLFTPPKKDTVKSEAYQRVLRLSRPRKNATSTKRIGAIASGLAGQEHEVVIFDATVAQPSEGQVIQRITPVEGVEANDIDILESDNGGFNVAYCTDQEVFISEVKYDFEKKEAIGTPKTPRAVFSLPSPDTFEGKVRPRLRSLRWLSPSHILLLVNLPKQSGVELRVLKLYSTRSAGTIVSTKKLARHVKAAVDMDISELNPDEKGARQIAIAVAGNDISISMFTIDYRGPEKESFSSLHNFTVLRDVHPTSITKVVLSPFHSPWTSSSSTPDSDRRTSPTAQYLRVASTSFGNTVVVDTFSLIPLQAKKHGSPYVLYTGASNLLEQGAGLFVLGFAFLVSLLLLQSYINAKGGQEIRIFPQQVLDIMSNLRPAGDRFHPSNQPVQQQVIPGVDDIPIAKIRHSLRDLLPHRRAKDLDEHLEDKAIVVTSSEDEPHKVDTDIHHDLEELAANENLKKWEDLSKHEKEIWKNRLSKAGQWAANEGETVLKGVFFGELAGMVGRAAAEAIHG
ncbi:hypothetical protein EJ05DRAFT_536176 [Pseudovirgaria hyperparasitica]|uniref:Guanine nucleotide-exchange factor SEC12 n=1 Tax=Pseudovirgaria hyperparasitica TaxID=470096 RepID=A0A6A6WHC6_9PEZI|nr:uncharacterized protein EJ05DRAFT_536176 [Pseudovirgaria hyperparasitica]KAF2761396.1 hypothetical protein EJ05DRAFT_536176 [Pseudovirgaria hyperparasitica]